MGTMTIDGRKIEFTDEKNVLSVIRKAGINIPTHIDITRFYTSLSIKQVKLSYTHQVEVLGS